MMMRRTLAALGAAMLALALVACGGSGTNTPAGGGTTSAPAGGKAAQLKLSGTWTYNGPLTGHLVCFHSSSGHLEMEGQQPYLVDLIIDGLQDGTFAIPDYLKVMTRQIQDPPGAPKVRLSRLQKVGDPSAASFPPGTGTVTIADGGATGTATWTSDGGGAGTITAELHWQGCPVED
jgi:hypothetical protein